MKLSDSIAIVGAFAAAFVASIVTEISVFQVTQGLLFWRSEAVTVGFAAAIWMAVGLKIAPRFSQIAVLLFLSGTGVAWFFCRGVVHSSSPYYGLASLGAATVGASLAWAAMAHGLRDRVMSVAIPGVTILLVSLSVLAQPTLGVTRELTQEDGQTRWVHVTYVGNAIYLWTTAELSAAGKVRVELDPGSGVDSFRLQPVVEPATRALVCDHFSSDTRRLVVREVDGGYIPAFVTRLPFHAANCAEGQVWALLH